MMFGSRANGRWFERFTENEVSRLRGPFAGVLLIVSGLLSTIVTLVFPTASATGAELFALNGSAAVLFGVLVWRLPWHRWPGEYSHAIVIISFIFIAIGDYAINGGPRFNIFYVSAFTWIGLLHPRGTTIRFMPLLAVAYLVPALLRGDGPGLVAAPFIYTVFICLLVGETIAWLADKLQRAERDLGAAQSSRRFRSLVEHISDVIAIIDRHGRVQFISPSVAQMLGYQPETIVGRGILAGVHRDDRPAFRRFIESCVCQEPESRSLEIRFRHADGGFRELELLAVNRLDDQQVKGVLFTGRDVTGRNATVHQLRAAEERYRTLIEQLPAITYVKDAGVEGPIWVRSWVSPQSEDILGYTAEEWQAGIDYSKSFIHADDLLRVQDQDEYSNETGEPFDAEYRVFAKDGRTIWVRDYARLIRDKHDAPLHWQGLMFDVSDQKAMETRLEQLALYDDLTGLANRAMLIRELERLRRRPRVAISGIGLIFLDIDNFKLINDSFGHATGDRVIEAVARRLHAVTPGGDLVARFGGDEFAILLVGSNPTSRGQDVAREITEIMADPIHIDGREINVTVSIGLAVSQADIRLSDDLLRDADVAMYEAKQRGRDQCVTFDDSMQERVWERMMLESALRQAVDREQLQLYYQPIVNLATGDITKLEALVRWRHPTRGLLMPVEFVGIAEETGLIQQIGEWVLHEACRQARVWVEESATSTIPAISVNLSPRQFLHPHLAEDIRRMLEETGLPAHYLELEITESTAMEDPRMVARTLKSLKALDVLITLDDFGTGYSGLSYLTRFPIDTLKIDRSFVQDLGKSAADLAIVQTILAFSQSLGLATVAEGIETLEQHTQLLELGCTHGQGYYFSEPVPAQEIEMLLHGAGSRERPLAAPRAGVRYPGVIHA